MLDYLVEGLPGPIRRRMGRGRNWRGEERGGGGDMGEEGDVWGRRGDVEGLVAATP